MTKHLRLLLGSCLLVSCGHAVQGGASPEVAPAAELTPCPPVPPAPALAPLFGFWGLNGFIDAQGLADVEARYCLTVFHHATRFPEEGVTELLPKVRAAGLRVTLRLTGGHSHYTAADGSFELAAWKAMLAPWGDSGVQEFIEDGTLVGHMLLDDITLFKGTDPTAADLEEMARYSKELMPGLMTFVRQRATLLPEPEGGRYTQVDAAVNQYRSMDGPVEVYAAREAARAAELDLGVINGLNLPDGGDGSSRQAGWRKGFSAMTAAEVERYGAVMVDVPTCGMFLGWEYDALEPWSDGTKGSDYFDQPELQAALRTLGERMARHPVVPLRREERLSSPPPPAPSAPGE